MIYIGIDPGLGGAVGVLRDKPETECAEVFDTPTVLISKNGKNRKVPLVGEMARILRPFAEREDVFTVLEDVHAMPRQGVSSTFTFGEGKGIWEGILGAFDIMFDKVSPQRWKKAIMADQGKDKDAARFKAMALFPSLSDQLSRRKDDGRAEAILMAEFGRRMRTK